jgi:hypothetical protein
MSGFNEQTIPVSFPRQQWEHVLTMLARQPFNEVAPLIADIQRQCQMHEMRQRAGQTPPRLAPEDYGTLPEAQPFVPRVTMKEA